MNYHLKNPPTYMDVHYCSCGELWDYPTEAEWRIHASVNWVIIGSGNGLSPMRRQAITWTNVDILIIIQCFKFNKMHLKMSAKRLLFCLGLNELICSPWCHVSCQYFIVACHDLSPYPALSHYRASAWQTQPLQENSPGSPPPLP